MRVAAVLLVALLGASPAWAQQALRSGSAASSVGTIYSAGSATCTLGTAALAGDSVVVGSGWTHNRTVTTAVDNNANALTSVFTSNNSGNFVTAVAYTRYVSSGTVTSVTITLSANVASSAGIWCAAFTNSATSGLVGATSVNNAGSGATHSAGSTTTTAANSLLFSVIAGGMSRTVSTADGDYTVAVADSGSAFFFFGVDYRLLTATETNDHTLTMSGGMASAHGLGELQGISGGGDTGKRLMIGVGQ